jgi:hypothetical protein
MGRATHLTTDKQRKGKDSGLSENEGKIMERRKWKLVNTSRFPKKT